MATIRSNIPHGSLLASLRQRAMDEYQAAEEKKKKQAAFTNQMIQLGGMAAGAALGGPLGVGLMAGAGLGGTAGGLLGNAVTGTPTSMGQGVNALMSVGNMMNQTTRADAYAKGIDEGMTPTTPGFNGTPSVDNFNRQFGPQQTPSQAMSPTDMQSTGQFQMPGGGMGGALSYNIAQAGQAQQQALWEQDFGVSDLKAPGGEWKEKIDTQNPFTGVARTVVNKSDQTRTITEGGVTRKEETGANIVTDPVTKKRYKIVYDPTTGKPIYQEI